MINFASAQQSIPAGTLVGEVRLYVGSAAPTGWIIMTGSSPTRTIGDASSGADRANADTEDLFTLFWNSMDNAQAAVSGGRGASAAADFAAHKTLTIPDPRGRAVIGAGTGSGLTARTHGGTSGAETHQLSTAELPSHSHETQASIYRVGGSTFGVSTYSLYNYATVSAEIVGGNAVHNNMQPWLALNLICKL